MRVIKHGMLESLGIIEAVLDYDRKFVYIGYYDR